jgi:prolyl oligopeptidase PreP (S9A serine peptidase family)/DNA-binding transcriptional ArsR family regulator
VSPAETQAGSRYPDAPRSDLAGLLHRDRAADPYRWLDDAGDPATVAWTAAQARLSERVLSGLPGVGRFRDRVRTFSRTPAAAPGSSRQLTYRAQDGTLVTMAVLAADGEPAGPHPALLRLGDGEAGLPADPVQRAAVYAWVEAGGVYAAPSAGGFHSAADWLIRAGWTSPDQLAISGGVAAAAAIVQRSDLYRAAVCTGAGPVPAVSPYDQVRAQVPYPAVLLTVPQAGLGPDPLHARKLTAALQYSSTSARPVLLRAACGTAGLSAEALAFLALETGLPVDVPTAVTGHRLADIGQLRAIADQLRLDLLDLLMSDPDRNWSARQLADRTGSALNRLHYHLRLLEEHGLICARWVEVAGRHERRYAAAHRQIWFARGGERATPA